METLNLKTAISHIRQVTDSADVASGRSPFFFIVGSGISTPVVPLASEIERKCRDIAKTYGRLDTPPGDEPIDTYSHWFSQAMPHPRERQEHLRDLIEGKPISPANFRLAHLLLDASVTNLVVTPNFDDFLSRALALFGLPHIVCDHPATVERIDPERPDIKIVHVHGTYWFYDCCNLRDEIVQRAQASTETGLTMRSLLDNILSHRSPLVIGYSGWEGDVIMEAIKRRLSTRVRLQPVLVLLSEDHG